MVLETAVTYLCECPDTNPQDCLMSSDGNLEIKETKNCYQGYIVKLTEKKQTDKYTGKKMMPNRIHVLNYHMAI